MAKKADFGEAKQNTVIEQLPDSARAQAKRRKINVAIRLCVPVLALVFAIIGLSFSWFHFSTEANVNEFDVTVIKVNNTLVSTEDGTWKDSIVFNTASDFSFKPVASDGTSFFLQRQYDGDDRIGEWKDVGGGNSVFVPSYDYAPITDIKAGKNLTCLDFKVKSDFDSYVHLSAESKVAPKDESKLADNAAVAAMRVAMYSIDEDGDAKLMFIWVPNTTYQVTTSETGTGLNKNSTIIEKIEFVTGLEDGKAVFTEFDTDGKASGSAKINDGNATLYWGDLSEIEEELLPTITLKGGEIQEFRVVMWFEATDRECETFAAGGNINTELLFTSELKEGGEEN